MTNTSVTTMQQQTRPHPRPHNRRRLRRTRSEQKLHDKMSRGLAGWEAWMKQQHPEQPTNGANVLVATPSNPNPYHPGSKGTATWRDGVLVTSDNLWITGTVRPKHYEYVKGIDLVNHFTTTYLEECKEAKQKQGAKSHKANNDGNSLQIPNPNRPLPWFLKNRQPNRRPHFPFLALPTELRSAIYTYLIPESRILIQTNNPNKEFAELNSRWRPDNEIVYKPRLRLSHLLDNDDIDNGLAVSGTLLLLNKQIHEEVTLMMYGRLTFCFDSINVVHQFMRGIGEHNLKAIKKLELHNSGYGQPRLADNKKFKDKHDRSWHKMCIDIASKMPALRSLKLDVHIQDWPVTLRHRDRWFNSLTKLAPNKLNHVEVILSHKMIGQNRLEKAARRLEDAMMTEEGRKARDDKELADAVQRFIELEAAAKAARIERLKSLPPVQAKKVLCITLDQMTLNDDKTDAKPLAKKYYTSKTKGFARDFQYGVREAGWV